MLPIVSVSLKPLFKQQLANNSKRNCFCFFLAMSNWSLTVLMWLSRAFEIACACSVFSLAMMVKLLIS